MLRPILFTLIWMGVLSLLSQVPLGKPETMSCLRLSWKTTGQAVRVPVAEDPSLPPHMRAPGGAFETVVQPYRLQVVVQGRTLLDRLVEASGVRHDRPLSVLEELRLAPGETELEVRFLPEREVGPRWELRRRVLLEPGRVTLVRLDPAAGLVVGP